MALKYDLADRWYEEDEPIYAHPKDTYHRVDVRSSSSVCPYKGDGQHWSLTSNPSASDRWIEAGA